MARRVPLNFTQALVGPTGKATLAFQKWLYTVGLTTNEVSDLAGDADDISDGITRRITDIVNEAITRNTDGTISQIVQTDPLTDAQVAIIDVNYSNGQLAEVAVSETTSTGATQVTTSTFTYSGDLIQNIDLTIGTA